jgi:tetratricopeptide (TPR) repeat protein
MLARDQVEARARAMKEYMAAQELDADRAEARLNLGALHAERGESEAAEREYLAALKLSPHFPATYVNLADLYREMHREEDAVRVLREGLAESPGSADVPHALGLALVRGGKLDEALPLLERATTLAPDVTRYAYVYGVALESAGPPGRGIEVLKAAHDRRPNDCDILVALVEYSHNLGRLDDALGYAGLLAVLRPEDAGVRAMREKLRTEGAKAPKDAPK